MRQSERIVLGVSDVYIAFEASSVEDIRYFCHKFNIIPKGVCKVSVIFIREGLTGENCNEKFQDRGNEPDDSTGDLFQCEDADHL